MFQGDISLSSLSEEQGSKSTATTTGGKRKCSTVSENTSFDQSSSDGYHIPKQKSNDVIDNGSGHVQQGSSFLKLSNSAIRRTTANIDFKYVKLFQLLCGVYILIVTFTDVGALGVFGGARDPKTGFIVDPNSVENTLAGIIEYKNFGKTVTRAIVARDTIQMILLGISRFSAFFMYPAIFLVFWSKLRATQAMMNKTPFSVFCIKDTHRLHTYCGWVILIDGILHSVSHMTRWGLQGNIRLLLSHRSGLTGLLVIISTIMIVVPMTWMKDLLAFEIRKCLHFLFWIFCIAMTLHAPFHALPNGGFCVLLFPILMITYGLDALYVKCFMSERVSTVKYKAVDSGTELTLSVSERFQKRLHTGGYAYIVLEWIDKKQWHVFSLYENAQDKSVRHAFIARRGDWTEDVHQKVCASTARPVWICGPFPSPYYNAINFDNMILVAAGIGITPALSAIETYRDSRRVNLIWAVRDASTLVFFLENAKLDIKGLNLIFYTGKEPLPSTIENHNGCSRFRIVKGRPNLSDLIPKIIQYVEKISCTVNDREQIEKFPSDEKTQQSNSENSDEPPEFYGVDVELAEGPSMFHGVNIIDSEDTVISTEKSNNISHSEKFWDRQSEAIPENNDCIIKNRTTPKQNKQSIWRMGSQSNARRYVQSMPKDKLETWGLLYCGRRSGLLHNLVHESNNLGIALHEEAFDW